jgi:Circularly permutated YpsA SLOG family
MRLRAAIRAGEDRPPLRSVSPVQPVLPEYLQGELVNSGFIALARAATFAGDRVAADKLKSFIAEHRVKILNVAGPRASKEPGVGEFVISILDKAFVDIGG